MTLREAAKRLVDRLQYVFGSPGMIGMWHQAFKSLQGPQEYMAAQFSLELAALRAALAEEHAAPQEAEPWGYVLHLPDDLYGYCYAGHDEAMEAAEALDLVSYEIIPLYRAPPAAPARFWERHGDWSVQHRDRLLQWAEAEIADALCVQPVRVEIHVYPGTSANGATERKSNQQEPKGD